MYSIPLDLIALVIAFKRELLFGLVGGVIFSLVFRLYAALDLWLARSEVQRLLCLERQRPSTYLLAGLASAAWSAGMLVLIPLRPMDARLLPGFHLFVALLFLVGFAAGAAINLLLARRLARQIVAMRTLSPG